MAKTNVLDNYDQYATMTILTSGAGNAAAYIQQLQTGLTNRQTVGWKISRVEYFLAPTLVATLSAAGHVVRASLTQLADKNQDDSPDSPQIVDQLSLYLGATPAALGGPFIEKGPYVHEFSEGHERLVTPQNIYFLLYHSLAGAPVAASSYMRIWYKEVELTAEDWYDLLQLRTPLSS